MHYFLGCDVAKAKLDISLIDDAGRELFADTVTNDTVAIATLLLTIAGSYPGSQLTCVVESTGCYHFTACEAAYAVGVNCLIYNPLLTKQQIKSTVRGKKTDRTDALLIARLGLRGEGYAYAPEPYRATKYQARGAQKLSVLGSSFKRHHRHMEALLEAETSDQTRALMQGIQDAIDLARKQVYKDLACSADGDIFRRLQTIPGIGPYVGASLIGEIQDMHKFTTTKALTAFAGLDPKIRQSGKSLNSTGRLTKRGSSYLRRSIFIAANVARRYDPNMKAIYDKKRAEGKSYKVATIVVARKLLSITRAIWLSGEVYDVTYTEKA